MGISIYYEVVPESLLSELSQSQELMLAFESFWGQASGMYGGFTDLEE